MFNFISNWRQRLIDDPVDTKMTETMQVGLDFARNRVHVDTGFLRSTIGATYNKSTKTILLHADAKYALIEEMKKGHEYLQPAINAMAGVWGGTYRYEAHFMNAAPAGPAATPEILRERERSWKRGINLLARRKTKLVVRRWHRRYEAPWAADEVTLIR